MAADVSRHIAATREEGYHVFQGRGPVETEVYRGLDLDLERALRANELEIALPAAGRARDRAGRWASRRWCAGATRRRATCPPRRIVGIAERTGLIGTLTFWILNAALRQAPQWRAAGIAPRLAVNLSVAHRSPTASFPALVDQARQAPGACPPRASRSRSPRAR